MTPPEPAATRCPVCGDDNACGAAAGQNTCWCFSAEISPEVLALVPADQQGLACICARCAAQAAAASSSPQTETKRS